MLKRRNKQLRIYKATRTLALLTLLCASLALTQIALMHMHPGTKGCVSFCHILLDQFGSYFHKPFPIFLVMTSSPSQTTLKPRDACAVEAAAIHHPLSKVTLLTTSPLPINTLVNVLLELDNVSFETVGLEELLSDTPLESWYYEEEYVDSPFKVNHLSDAVRLALLWKYGGLYLDTDAICLRSLKNLRNTIGQQSSNRVNGAVMSFESRHPFLHQCMAVFSDEYLSNSWSAQGPLLLERVIKRKCKIAGTFSGQESILEKCWNITVLKPKAFYPIPYHQWHKLFNTCQNLSELLSETYTLHLWNKFSHNITRRPGSGTLMDVVARDNCPSVYREMKKVGNL